MLFMLIFANFYNIVHHKIDYLITFITILIELPFLESFKK